MDVDGGSLKYSGFSISEKEEIDTKKITFAYFFRWKVLCNATRKSTLFTPLIIFFEEKCFHCE